MKGGKMYIEIRERKTKKLVGIYFDPYLKGVNYIIDFWILPEFKKTVYGYYI